MGVRAEHRFIRFSRPRQLALGGVLVTISSGLGVAGASNPATGDTLSTATFSGSAAATTMVLRMVSPGAPGTDTPVESGGPTAQVAVDSAGSSTGYAAFPDPGQLVMTGPGLAIGLLASGAGGLPAVQLPSPPPYPFFVTSDSAAVADQSAGSGPYRISAHSEAGGGEASATGGFRSELTGSAALSTAIASIETTADGVAARATSDTEGLAIGPLSVGQIRSSAAQSLGRDGTVTPSSALAITGLKVGTLALAVTDDGMLVGGNRTPVPVNEAMAQLLAPSKITFEVLAAQEFSGRVVAPAVRISVPIPASAAGGSDPTTLTVLIGGATAALTGNSDASVPVADVTVGEPSARPVSGPVGTTAPDALAGSGSAPLGPVSDSEEPLSVDGAREAAIGEAQVAAAPSPRTAVAGVSRTMVGAQSPPLFDFNLLYAALGIGSVAVLLPALLIRLMGGRR